MIPQATNPYQPTNYEEGMATMAPLAGFVALGLASGAALVGEGAAAAGAVYRGYQAAIALGRGRALTLGVAGAAPQVSNFLNNVYSMVSGDPSGGPCPGSKGLIELSARSRTAKSFSNLSKKPIEFIFDGERFFMGNMKHLPMAEAAGVSGPSILGGTIWQKNGQLITNELSGAFHPNWNAQTRQQFNAFMSENGVMINHTTSMPR